MQLSYQQDKKGRLTALQSTSDRYHRPLTVRIIMHLGNSRLTMAMSDTVTSRGSRCRWLSNGGLTEPHHLTEFERALLPVNGERDLPEIMDPFEK